MPFIPHTSADVQTMLSTLKLNTVDELFSEIPPNLQIDSVNQMPESLSEQDVAKWIRACAKQDGDILNFIGAGAYEHYIPAAVWEIASRGEWMTAYTPYQAEASQGTLQLLYEYQSMMAQLMDMEVSNASLYEGASALAEAILMAARCLPKQKAENPVVGMPLSVHPAYRRVAQTLTHSLGITLIDIPFDKQTGQLSLTDLAALQHKMHILVIPQPNFFGIIEPVDEITAWAEKHGVLTIAQVNPMLMSYLTPPGSWGKSGVDFACGELQPLGIPLSSGGPYAGFLCCRQTWIRQLPGRLVGRTVDKEGKPGFVLTLQAREQHIRRAKATSNICTSQGLLVTAATIYMSLMGAKGLEAVAKACYQKTHALVDAVISQKIASLRFSGPYFHEAVLSFGQNSAAIFNQMREQRIEPGYVFSQTDPFFKNALLVCVTETKTEADISTWLSAAGSNAA
jgi:glycine dehydrogenase subunit 1